MELGNLSLALVGAGKMGGAMLAGWLDMGLDASKVTVIDPGQNDELKAFAADKGFALAATPEGVASPQIVVVAVKPQMVDKVLPTLTRLVGRDTVVVSVAAGKKSVDFRKHLGEETLVVRAMPNTPAQVGRGMTAAFADEKISQEMRDVVATLMSSMGRFVWVQSEDLIDAVTAISGSGPAYVFHLVEAMAKAGEALGLDAETAGILARQTIVGAGELFAPVRAFSLDPARECDLSRRHNRCRSVGSDGRGWRVVRTDQEGCHCRQRPLDRAFCLIRNMSDAHAGFCPVARILAGGGAFVFMGVDKFGRSSTI